MYGKNIKAEVLLNYIYPELSDKWVAKNKGTFFRNYSDDIMDLDTNNNIVELSRDGFLKLLPPGFLANKDEFLGANTSPKARKNVSIAERKRQELLKDLFVPIDTLNLRNYLKLESNIAKIHNNKLYYILKEYYEIDANEIKNKYIDYILPFVLFSKQLRGDIGFVQSVLSVLLDCKVDMKKGRYTQSHWEACSLPQVEYTLHIPQMTNAQYNELINELNPFFDFIREWFIPFDLHTEFYVRDFSENTLNKSMTLNYDLNIGD